MQRREERRGVELVRVHGRDEALDLAICPMAAGTLPADLAFQPLLEGTNVVACRRGHLAMAEFLMNEAKVRWDHQDDFGRTILHDACWRPEPCQELMDAILKVVSPEWLMAQDVRGHTPFDYSRREHSGIWYDYLKQNEEMLKRRLSLLA